MLDWFRVKNQEIFKTLRMKYGAKLLVEGRDKRTTEVDLTELTALNTTPGSPAAGQAIVLDSSGNFSMPATGNVGLSRATPAAAGTTAADATVLTAQVNAVTAADGAKGVALPAAATTAGPIVIINTVATAALLVYPVNGGNDNINSLAEDVAFQLAPGQAGVFTPVSGTQWYVEAYNGVANQKLATEAGAGITGGTGTIYRSSVVRNGGMVETKILIDLTGLASSTTDLDIIGQGASAAHLGQTTAARTGTNVAGSMQCLEAPAGGVTDIDLYSAEEGTGVFDAGIGTLTSTALVTSGGAWTNGATKGFTAVVAADRYLYLTGGAGGTAASYTAGIFLITLYGI